MPATALQFTKLRLSGFKSFADSAEVEIRPGLTGVVGPNGCGKSNLLEALRWVMGEGSARALRSEGASMEEVIFAGSGRRPRRDVAEVQLTLYNRDGQLPGHEAGELQVVRRVTRGAGSTYLLNGREVRQRDVRLLFADAATGAASPALVSQGQVAAIIHAQPQERRRLLADAAGIAGLDVRRREAEQRLRAADANLARLVELMQHQQRQATSLARQAKTAMRYRQLSLAIRSLEQQQLRASWQQTVDAVQQAGQEVEALRAEVETRAQAAANAAHRQATAASRLPDLRREQAAATSAWQKCQAELAAVQAQATALSRQLHSLRQSLANAEQDVGRESRRQQDAASAMARLQAEQETQQRLRAEAAAEADTGAQAVRDAEQQVEVTGRALAAAVEAHAKLVADGRGRRAQLQAADSRLQRLQQEKAQLTGEIERLQKAAQDEGLAQQLAAGEKQLAGLEAKLEAVNRQLATAETTAEQRQGRLTAVAQAEEALQRSIAALEAEAEALVRLRAGLVAGPDAPAADSVRALRTVIAAAPGHEAALAAALGSDADAVLADSDAAMRHWRRLPVPTDPAPLPDFATPLAPHVEAPPELARLLAQTGIVAAPPDRDQLASLHAGQRLVSMAGWLWRWDGLVVPPGAETSAIAEQLTQQNRQQEIAALLPPQQQRLRALSAEVEAERSARKAALEAAQSARAERSALERQRGQLQARLQGWQATVSQAAARLQAVDNSRQRLATEIAHAEKEEASAAAAVAALPDSSDAAQQVAACRRQDEQARVALAEVRARAATQKRQIAESEARLQRLGQEMADWQQRAAEAAATLEALQQRWQQLRATEAELVSEPDALQARAGLLRQDIAGAETARDAAEAAVLAAEMALAALDEERRAADASVAEAREASAVATAELARCRERLAGIIAQSQQRFGCRPAELAPAEDADGGCDLTQLQAERERLGAVNLRAADELTELRQEIAAREAEHADLQAAVQRLRASIAVLNREGRARLQAAFRQVNSHFQILYATLFEGGSAELVLVDDDDPLLCGLEIRAQPPGKKLQSLSLLSGGEQALTAVALVFALFQSQEAPVCVLDEVDASLDDVNVERLTLLLQYLARSTATRFLVVTHNPLTMAAMQRLYGVTMAEAGVSQLVSVTLPQATGEAALTALS